MDNECGIHLVFRPAQFAQADLFDQWLQLLSEIAVPVSGLVAAGFRIFSLVKRPQYLQHIGFDPLLPSGFR